MSAATLISVEEYLANPGVPESEYIDGVLRPRSMPTSLHGIIQALLIIILGKQGIGAFPEVSIRPSKTKFLIPDLIVDRNPIELPYPVKPVSLCVEILSPDDRLSAMFAKCEEYHAWGCPWCWVIDPVRQAAYEYHAGSCLNPVNRAGILRAGEIAISMEELFSALESRIPH